MSNRDELTRQAEKSLRQGRVDDAIAQYQELASLLPVDWCVVKHLADLLERAGQCEAAAAQFGRWADHLFAEGFHSKAAALYRKVLKLDTCHERALWQLGEVSIELNLRADARLAFERVLEVRQRRGDIKGMAEARERLRSLESAPPPAAARATLAGLTPARSLAGDRVAPATVAEARPPLGCRPDAVQRQPDATAPEPLVLAAPAVPVSVVPALVGVPPAPPPSDADPAAPARLRETPVDVEAAQVTGTLLPWAPDMGEAGATDASIDSPARARADRRLADADAVSPVPSPPAAFDWAYLLGRDTSDCDPAPASVPATLHQGEEAHAPPAGTWGNSAPETEPAESAGAAEALVRAVDEEIDLTQLLDELKGFDPVPPAPLDSPAPHTVSPDPLARPALPHAGTDLDAAFADLHRHTDAGAVAEQQLAAGRVFLAAGLTSEAARAFERASQAPRCRFEAAQALAELHRSRGQLAAAVSWYERAAAAPAADAAVTRPVLYDLAESLEALGETDRALGVLLDLLSQVEDYRDARARLERLLRVDAGG